MESAVFMGKNYLNNRHSITNKKDLTLRQMFDISRKLVSEQDEIHGVKTIRWENHSWKYLSLIGDERVINLQRTKVYVFSDSVLCLGKILENTQSNDAWEDRLGLDRIDGEPMEFEWNIFPGFNTLQLSEEVKRLLLRLDETPKDFTGRFIFMSMFNDISCGSKDNEKERLANARLVSLYAKRFPKGQWSFIGPGSEKKWYCISENSPQGAWDNMAERMMLKFGHKEENLRALHQEQFLLGREIGLMLIQENILSPIVKYRRKWFIFFVMDFKYIEKMMERFNSGEWRKIFRNISYIPLIGLIASGNHAWQEEEEIRKNSSTVLILQEQLCISELFRDIKYSTGQCCYFEQLLRVHYHVGCAFNLHSIINSGLLPGGQSLSKRQLILWTKSQGSWWCRLECTASCTIPAQRMEETSRRRRLGRHQSCYWERIEILSDSIKCDHPSRNTSSLLYSESCEDGNWESYTKKYTCHLGLHQRSPWNTNRKEKWVQKMLNDQKDKLCNNPEVSNRTNQFQSQVMIERSNPLLEPITEQPIVGINTRTAQDRRKTSRSQQIDTRSFHEESCQKR